MLYTSKIHYCFTSPFLIILTYWLLINISKASAPLEWLLCSVPVTNFGAFVFCLNWIRSFFNKSRLSKRHLELLLTPLCSVCMMQLPTFSRSHFSAYEHCCAWSCRGEGKPDWVAQCRMTRHAKRSRCARAVCLGPVSATLSLASTDAAGGSTASLRPLGNYALT